MMLSLML